MPKKKPIQIIHGICQCDSCKKIREGNKNKFRIYMDPPYHEANPKLYSTTTWKEIDFVKLRNSFHELSCAGHSVILSMSDTPFIRELFKGYNIKIVKLTHDLTHKKVNELLITTLNDDKLEKIMDATIK